MSTKSNYRKKVGFFVRLPLPRRTKQALIGLFVIWLVGMALADRLELLGRPIQDDRSRYDQKVFRVAKVVDGDTLDLDVADVENQKKTTRVRLWGVDTPETKHPTMALMYFGKEAAAFSQAQAEGRDVKVVLEPFKGTRGKYGRLLAYVYLPDGKMLNEELICRGLGYADERFEHMFYDRFLALQKQAQRQEEGLWKSVRADQWPSWYRQRHDKSDEKSTIKP